MKPDLFYFNIAIVTVYPFRDKNEKSYKQVWPVDPEQQYSPIYSRLCANQRLIGYRHDHETLRINDSAVEYRSSL